jgi:lysophospholipase L1-like esterase
MRFTRWAVAVVAATITLTLVTGCKKNFPPPSLDPNSLSILCLGDSITAGTHGIGDNGQLSYPGVLSSLLKQVRGSVQVINEGQNGWTVDDVADHAAGWIQPQTPDIILLQIGTNDLEQGATPQQAAQRLDLLIAQLQSLAPSTHLYVANCTRVRSDNKPNLSLSVLAQFNALVPKVVRDHTRRGHFIVFVDLYKRAGMIGSDLGPDGEHPDDTGYQKMAVYWEWVLRRHEGGVL